RRRHFAERHTERGGRGRTLGVRGGNGYCTVIALVAGLRPAPGAVAVVGDGALAGRGGNGVVVIGERAAVGGRYVLRCGDAVMGLRHEVWRQLIHFLQEGLGAGRGDDVGVRAVVICGRDRDRVIPIFRVGVANAAEAVDAIVITCEVFS